jgi:hypothetical protein
VVVVDEVGPLELTGGGWAPSLGPLLGLKGVRHLWVVREGLVERVRQAWDLHEPLVVEVNHSLAFERLEKFCLEDSTVVD